MKLLQKVEIDDALKGVQPAVYVFGNAVVVAVVDADIVAVAVAVVVAVDYALFRNVCLRCHHLRFLEKDACFCSHLLAEMQMNNYL